MVPPQNIKRRKGTTNHGVPYEQKIAALLGIRCVLNNDVEDMWMATNVEGLGAFDDLLLFLQIRKKKELYLIQSKYKQNRPICLSSGENSLQKYQESFFDIKKAFLNDTSPLKDTCQFENIKFILFTNGNISGDVSLVEYTDTSDLINTGKMFQISSSIGYDSEFVKQTFVYSSQVDVSKVQNRLQQELDIYFKKYVILDIIKFFEDWHSGNFAQKETLSQEDFQSLILQTVLSHYIPDPIMEPFPKAAIWNNATEHLQHVFVKEKNSLPKLWEAVQLQIRNFFYDKNFDLLNWNQRVPQIKSKIDKIKQRALNNHYPLRNDKGSYSIRDLYILLWQICEIPLVLHLNMNDTAYDDICIALSKLSSKNRKRYLLFGRVTSNFPQYSKCFNISDINWDLREKVLENACVWIQGKKSVTLEELELNNITLEKICPDLLIDMLQINSQDTEVDQSYVPRIIEVPTVSELVFRERNAVFVIVTGGRVNENHIKLRRFGMLCHWHLYKHYSNRYGIEIKTLDRTEEITIILKKDIPSSKEYLCIESIVEEVRKCKDQTIHYLRYVDANKLEWLYSNKNSDQIKQFLVPTDSKVNLGDKNLFQHLTFNSIWGNAGEGKSTLLHFLADECPSNIWVIKLNMSDLSEYIGEGDFSTIKRFLHDQDRKGMDNYDEFSWQLFQTLYDERNIFVTIDGIDEVEIDSNTEQFLYEIKNMRIKTIIAVRPSLRIYLEEKFKMSSFSLKPFTNEDSALLIKLTLQSKYEEFSESYINENLQKISLWDNIVGIPLLLKLFASLLNDANLSDFGEFNITDLFDKYIKEQLRKVDSCNAFSYRTLSRLALFVFYNINAVSEIIHINDYFEDLEEKENVFVKSKLIDKIDKNCIPIFAHKSLAEFLVAHYLANRYDSISYNILKSLFYKEFETVRAFFDIIILKDSPLYDFVFNGNISDFNYDLCDKLGRNCLHIAISYGNRCDLRTRKSLWAGVKIYESYNEIDSNSIKPSKKFERKIIVPLDRFRHIITKGMDLNKKDAVFKMDVFDFALESGSLEMIEILFREQFEKELKHIDNNILLYYTVRNGHLNIFQRIKNKNFKLKILPNEDNLLYAALCSENFEIIRELTSGCIDMNEPNKYGITPFISWMSGQKIDYSRNLITLHMPREIILNEIQVSIIRYFVVKKVNLNNANLLGETPLHIICRSQDSEQIKSLLELLLQNGAEVNKKTILGDAPLHYAAQKSLDNVKLLLKHKSDIDISNSYGFSPLCFAVASNLLDIVRCLIKKGAFVNRDKRLISPLNTAVSYGHVDCVRLLIEKNARINNSPTNNTLELAITSGHLNCVKLLIEKGVKIEKKLLYKAIPFNNKDIIKYILSETHRICDEKHDNSPFFLVVECDYIDLIEVFVSHGADINAKKNQCGNTPLHAASIIGLEDVTSHLIKHGAKVNVENKLGEIPLLLAAKNSHLSCAEVLISSGSDLEKYGAGAVFLAVTNGHNAVYKYLVSLGLDINGFDSDGFAPIHHAASTSLDSLRNVILKGGDTSLKTKVNGFTPLMLAAAKGFLDSLQYLTKLGANINEEDVNHCRSALTLSSCDGHLECVKFLIDKGSDLEKKGPTAIALAAYNGHYSLANYLLSVGADINGFMERDVTPLHFAVIVHHLELVQYLLSKGANINLLSDGKTPLMLAASLNYEDIVACLTECS